MNININLHQAILQMMAVILQLDIKHVWMSSILLTQCFILVLSTSSGRTENLHQTQPNLTHFMQLMCFTKTSQNTQQQIPHAVFPSIHTHLATSTPPPLRLWVLACGCQIPSLAN